MPRNINANLLTRIQQPSNSLCVLFRAIDKFNNTIVALTTHSEDVPNAYIEGSNITFQARPGLFGSRTAADLTMAIDNSEVGAYLVSNVININTLYGGRIDGARYALYICDYEDPSATTAPYCYDRGFLGEIPISDTAFKVGLRSLITPMHQPIGSILQPGCRVLRLGDMGTCNFPMSGTVRSGSSHRFRLSFATVQTAIDAVTFTSNGLAGGTVGFTSQPDVWFAEGILKWITTANGNNNIESEVRTYDITGTTMTFILQDAPGGSIVGGDTFSVDAGCNRTTSHCYHKFRTDSPAGYANGNIHNFQGEPHLTDESELVVHADRWDVVNFQTPPVPVEAI